MMTKWFLQIFDSVTLRWQCRITINTGSRILFDKNEGVQKLLHT